MLLSITNKQKPATDLGYLLHKKPSRCQEIALNFGKAYVFYPEATDFKCTASLMLDIDPIGMVRGKVGRINSGPLDQYVNDRPYVASSFMSVAIAKTFGSALQGKCNVKPELVDLKLPLAAKISVLPCPSGDKFLKQLFEPLGYQVSATPFTLDPKFNEWGNSKYYSVELKTVSTVKDLLTHLYVLIPVLDNNKHYYVGEAEIENLLAKGQGWLSKHPNKEIIAKRYLRNKISLARQALSRLIEEAQLLENGPNATANAGDAVDDLESLLEKPLSLNEQRIKAVISKLSDVGAKTVIDMGCGDGKLLRDLIPHIRREKSIEKIAGMDVSIRPLEIAHRRIGMDRLPNRIQDKINLFQGSLMYKDKRFAGYDAAVVMEVVEHLDPPRLTAFEKVLFKHTNPKTVILTTPNREYNRIWEKLPEGALRHRDHRFEWTRSEFKEWADGIAQQYNYSVAYYSIGPEAQEFGSPTQMGVFKRGD